MEQQIGNPAFANLPELAVAVELAGQADDLGTLGRSLVQDFGIRPELGPLCELARQS